MLSTKKAVAGNNGHEPAKSQAISFAPMVAGCHGLATDENWPGGFHRSPSAPASKARSHDTAETSVAALQSVLPLVSKRKQAILALLDQAGAAGLTRYELSDSMGVPIQSVCGRARELVQAVHVVEVGDTRPAPSGRASKVLRLPQHAGGVTNG